MTFVDELNKALRYHTKADWQQAVSQSDDATPHLSYADWLEENGEPETAGRVRTEAQHNLMGHPVRPVRLGDNYSEHDYVLHAVRTDHRNPTVRALAQATEAGHPPNPDLINLLFHSEHPADTDVAVFLAPEDRPAAHTPVVNRINRNSLTTGLMAKTVRGTVYLMDNETPDHRAFGAPQIVFHSPATDQRELAAMAAHADHIATERAEVPMIGPVH